MEIQRDKYIQRLSDRMHNGLIKVITGIRRSGKSYLLFRLFKNYLVTRYTDEKHIISVELDRLEHKEFRQPIALLNHINSHIKDEQMHYVFLDEVQLLEDFEDVLNSLLRRDNVDVYVTGSNSKFLSSDILTAFRGRGDEMHVFPLTFSEFMSVYAGDMYDGWSDYVTYGGLPLVQSMRTDEQKMQYLSRLFDETYLKDIQARHSIKKIQEMNDLIDILASCIGTLTNPHKIEATFKSIVKSEITDNTIRQYIDYLRDVFVVSEVQRYDIKGRKYIGAPVKYYFEDIGLRNARLFFRQLEETHIMENILYNELRYRGYQVDVGQINKQLTDDDGQRRRSQLEVDFVANLGNRRLYIQSALSMPTAEKVAQEKQSLLSVDDAFTKIILTKDRIKEHRDDNGILIMNVFDFLLHDRDYQ